MEEQSITIREVANWLGMIDIQWIKRWEWFAAKSYRPPGKMTRIRVKDVEEFIGGALEPMYTPKEVCAYLKMAMSTLYRSDIKRIRFGHNCARVPESEVTRWLGVRKTAPIWMRRKN